MQSKTYWVYIGVTGDLERRMYEHRKGLIPGFASRYLITRLINAEPFADVRQAIGREKELKGWRRERNLTLVLESNPEWHDLAEEWFGPVE